MAGESVGGVLETGRIHGLQQKTSWPCAIGCSWTSLAGEVETNPLLLSVTFAQEVGIIVDELWKRVFMYLFGCVCVVIMCASQSSSTSWCQTQHPLPPRVPPTPPAIVAGCQLLSAVRRTGDCCLGDHYRGHKRTIYRTTGEWSPHSSLSPHPQDCTVLGHQWGAQNWVQQGTRWLKHEGPETSSEPEEGIIDVRSKLKLFPIQS